MRINSCVKVLLMSLYHKNGGTKIAEKPRMWTVLGGFVTMKVLIKLSLCQKIVRKSE